MSVEGGNRFKFGVNTVRAGVAAAAIFGGAALPRDTAISAEASLCPPAVQVDPPRDVSYSADSVGVSEISNFDTQIQEMGPEAAILAYNNFKESVSPYIDMSRDQAFWEGFDRLSPEALEDRFDMKIFPGGYGAEWRFKPQPDPQALPAAIVQQTWGEHGVDAIIMQASRDGEGNIKQDTLCGDATITTRVNSFRPGDPVYDLEKIDKSPLKGDKDIGWKPLHMEHINGKTKDVYIEGKRYQSLVFENGDTSFSVIYPEVRRLNNLHP